MAVFVACTLNIIAIGKDCKGKMIDLAKKFADGYIGYMEAEDFRNWRKRMGYRTQALAARDLGVTANTVARYETSQRNIPDSIERLCAALEKLRECK